MRKSFSSDELYLIRNKISITKVILSLGIPNKKVEEIFRFLCPECGEFQTAINDKTNLSRCFRCAKNFNTIEIVMAERKTNFVESVKFLKQHFDKLSHFPALTSVDNKNLKSADQDVSSDGCLSSLERQLVEQALPLQSLFPSGKNV